MPDASGQCGRPPRAVGVLCQRCAAAGSERPGAADTYQGRARRDPQRLGLTARLALFGERGFAVGKAWVQQLMVLHGIRSKCKQCFKVATDRDHKLPISPNLLNREFTVAEPD